MVGCHNRLNGHEFEQALGVGDGQGSLACYVPWGCKESDTTELLNCTELRLLELQRFIAGSFLTIFTTMPSGWMDLEPVIQSELSQKEKNKYHVLMHLCEIQKDGSDEPICRPGTEM